MRPAGLIVTARLRVVLLTGSRLAFMVMTSFCRYLYRLVMFSLLERIQFTTPRLNIKIPFTASNCLGKSNNLNLARLWGSLDLLLSGARIVRLKRV